MVTWGYLKQAVAVQVIHHDSLASVFGWHAYLAIAAISWSRSVIRADVVAWTGAQYTINACRVWKNGTTSICNKHHTDLLAPKWRLQRFLLLLSPGPSSCTCLSCRSFVGPFFCSCTRFALVESPQAQNAASETAPPFDACVCVLCVLMSASVFWSRSFIQQTCFSSSSTSCSRWIWRDGWRSSECCIGRR